MQIEIIQPVEPDVNITMTYREALLLKELSYLILTIPPCFKHHSRFTPLEVKTILDSWFLTLKEKIGNECLRFK